MPWKDLSQDILALVLNKLHLTDRCRFRAVCKNWRVPLDRINPCPEYPWLVHHHPIYQPSSGDDVFTFGYRLFDPYSEKLVHQLSKSVVNFKSPSHHQYSDFVKIECAPNYGWILIGLGDKRGLSLVLHNPFSDNVIVLPPLDLSLPSLPTYMSLAAMLTAVPTCNSDCEVLLLCPCDAVSSAVEFAICICRYRLSSMDKQWTRQPLITNKKGTRHPLVTSTLLSIHLDMQLIDGELHCLFKRQFFYPYKFLRYSLADNRWESLSPHDEENLVPMCDEEGSYLNWRGRFMVSWLTQIEGTLTMLCQISRRPDFRDHEWMIFKLDWLTARWVLATYFRNTAFFMTPNKIVSHAPLVDIVDLQDDCLIFHSDVRCKGPGGCDGQGLKCYSFKRKEHVPVPEPYRWIVPMSSDYSMYFIETPSLTLDHMERKVSQSENPKSIAGSHTTKGGQKRKRQVQSL